MRNVLVFGAGVMLAAGLWFDASSWTATASQEQEKLPVKNDVPNTPEIQRTRKQAKMLDTLYKTAIVVVTENYVTGEESMAAGDAFQAIFKAMKDNGFHEVRLLDATGQPYDSDNAPANSFEKNAVKAIVGGSTLYEEMVREGDKSFLLTATPIPVVMEKCVTCHSNYEGVQGPIGALGLKIPIE
ncbi:MAG: DUF3365 domain-containing protein [Planctomycetaceae bacterium]|nr:DUF3365 domain-containing protein [Planctomycetaceae bacterium]